MPLPVRTASIRTNTADSRKTTSRLAQPSQQASSRKPQKGEDSKGVNVSYTEEIGSSAASATDSANGSQPSSRIPSPFKRKHSSQASHNQQASTNQLKPPLKSHSRQRSAVLPPLSVQQKLGHSRSISAVSVNTNSTLGSDISKAPAKSRFNVSQSPVKAAKTQTVPEARATLSAAPSLRGNANLLHLEPFQNELLQLSIVYKESTQGLRAFERSIAQSLAKQQAQLVSFRDDVQRRKQAFGTASNHLAIDSWLQNLGHHKTCQSVQELSVVVRDLQSLEQIFDGEDGLAAAFHNWQSLITDRDGKDPVSACTDYASLHVIFEQDLAPDLYRFEQQVASSVATLASLPPCLPGSSVSLIVQAQGSLARCLLSQCQVMLQVGDQLVLEHRQWLDQEIAAAVDELETPTAIAGSHSRPIWDT